MDKALRILHLNDRLSDRGGADWHLRGVLHRLSSKHQVLLAVGKKDPGIDPPCETRVVKNLDARKDAPIALQDFISEFQPDVLHLHNVVNPTALDWAARNHAIITVQDHRCFCPGQGKLTIEGAQCTQSMAEETCSSCFVDDRYFQEIFDLTIRRLSAVRAMHRIIVLSNYMRGELVQAGVDKNKIEVIPPFVHGFSKANREKEGSYILFVGRLVGAKGVEDAVNAWKLSGTSLPLVIAGAGPLRGTISEDGVEFKGWLDRQELGKLYGSAAVVVLCSRWQEPFGIVGLEALSLKTPVVAWESGGISDWYPGRPTAWGDVAALAQAMAQAIGKKAEPDPRFEPMPLMEKLETLYTRCARSR